MSYYVIDKDALESNLQKIAILIRQKTGVKGELKFPNDFVYALSGDFVLVIHDITTNEEKCNIVISGSTTITWSDLASQGVVMLGSGGTVIFEGSIVHRDNGLEGENTTSVTPNEVIEKDVFYYI